MQSIGELVPRVTGLKSGIICNANVVNVCAAVGGCVDFGRIYDLNRVEGREGKRVEC